MANVLVLDTAGLIALARLGRLEAARALAGRLVAPPAVIAEATTGGRPGSDAVQAALDEGVLESQEPPVPAEPLVLGAGETAAIALGRSLGAPVLLDDLEARRTAERLGVTVVGTVAILVALVDAGAIGSIADELARLEGIGFRLGPDVRQWALGAVSR